MNSAVTTQTQATEIDRRFSDPRHERAVAEAQRFLTALFGEQPAGRIVLWAARSRSAAWPLTVPAAAARAVTMSYVDDIHFGVAPRRLPLARGRGTARDVLALPALWADLDVQGPAHALHDIPSDGATTRALLHDFPLAPSAIVQAGDGHQAYWFLDSPFPNDDLAATRVVAASVGLALAHVADRHGWRLDPHAYDPAHIMRLPGTLNRRLPRGRPVRLEHLDPAARYPVEELRQAAIAVIGREHGRHG